MISCENYIDQMLRVHMLDKISSNLFQFAVKTPSPLLDNTFHKIFKECGSDEGTFTAYKFKLITGFVYQTLLGEMMYVYVICRPDIGYAITTMSKFSAKPSSLYYQLLKGIAKYFCFTKDWGTKSKSTTERPEMKEATFHLRLHL